MYLHYLVYCLCIFIVSYSIPSGLHIFNVYCAVQYCVTVGYYIPKPYNFSILQPIVVMS